MSDPLGGPDSSADGLLTRKSGRKRLLSTLAPVLAGLGAASVSVQRDHVVQAVLVFSSVQRALKATTTLLRGQDLDRGGRNGLSLGMATGEVPLGLNRIEGCPAFQRAVGLAQLAGPNQVLAAAATFESARDTAPEEFGFRDCGTVYLDSQSRRDRVFQVTHPAVRTHLVEFLGEDHVVNTLPTSLGYFLGREYEITLALRGLEEHRVVQIVGPGGIGKTHLAWRIGSDMLDIVGEGVLWINMGGCRTQQQVVERISEHVGGVRRFPYSLEVDLAKQLRNRQLLFVLDGCDTGATAIAAVLKMLCASSGPRFLLTACRRIPFAGGETIRLGPMMLPPRGEKLTPEELENFEASALFLDRARDLRETFAVGDGDTQTVSEIVHRLDGYPLAIVLAARKTRAQTPEQILAHLGPVIGTGHGHADTDEGRQKSLRDALRYSISTLSPVPQLVLRRMSIFQAAWTAMDAAVMADLDETAAEEVVKELSEAGIIAPAEGPTGRRAYQMPNQVRRFARTLLIGDELDVAKERHCLRFVDLLSQVSKEQGGPTHGRELDLLDFHREDLAQAFEFMIEEGRHFDSFVDAMVLSWSFWYRRNRVPEALRLIDRGLRSRDLASRVDMARLLNVAGVLANKGGNPAKARTYYRRAMRAAAEIDNPNALPSIMANLAILEWSEASPNAALGLFEHSISMTRRLSDTVNLYRRLESAVGSYFEVGKYSEAESALREAIELGGNSDDPLDRWCIELGWGQIALARGQSAEARDRFVSAVRHAEEIGDKAQIARTLIWVAQALVDLGRFDQAGKVLGAISSFASATDTYLYRTNELRISRIEGLVRSSIGDRQLAELRLVGALSDLSELLSLAPSP